ncbi:glycosyltransferase family 39 protein [uncultured Veillonella sp.]|uniref:ArnT family glycosyltransferase n=1 Tax=uncultured Veillonella sp. TaxID=159268 RepID=UPI0028DB5055|nr:glycosyltransferase family 39 protein [uncultured Veillonella sp.]
MINNHMLRIGALFLLTVLSYGFYNAYLPITDPVESNYVLSAITMIKHNSWISPMIYDQVWYDKPPLTYWALMITYKLFGISDFTSRIPNTLIAGGSVALMYHLVYRIKESKHIAIMSALILFSALQFWYISHAVITDGFLFFFSLAIFGYSYLAFTKKDANFMVKAYGAAALAVVTKGPVGIVLPGLILCLFVAMRWFSQKDNNNYTLTEDIKLLFNPLGILLFIVLASPWYIAMYSIHGQEFISGFLGLHNMERALVSEHPKFNVWYYYLIIVPIALLPWTPSVIYQLKNIKWKENFYLLGAIWFIVIVLFYSLVATKYITYTLPAIIPCIIWGAEAITNSFHNKSTSFKYIVTIPLAIYVLLFLVASIVTPELNPVPLIVALILIVLFTLLAKQYNNNKLPLSIYLTTPLTILYTAITITVTPILFDQSGLQFKPYIESNTHPTYIYGTYYTSILYYTEDTPTQVFVHTTDNPLWTAGKTLMPTITVEEFEKRVSIEKGAIIIVPNKYIKEFTSSPTNIIATEVGKSGAARIYQIH